MLTLRMKQGDRQIKTHAQVLLTMLVLAMICSTPDTAIREGVRIEANGKVIDIERGDLVPCVSDWNNDGKKDLIVGQLSDGKVRLYLNHGTDSAPVFKDFSYLKAAGEEISLPSG